jgi:ABC-type glycerol-3-phosphate transport system substrate-binding protein
MKKLFAMVLTLAMALSLVACGGGAEEAPAPEAEGEKAPVTESAEPTKLTLILRGGTYGDVIKAALPAFEAENNVK